MVYNCKSRNDLPPSNTIIGVIPKSASSLTCFMQYCTYLIPYCCYYPEGHLRVASALFFFNKSAIYFVVGIEFDSSWAQL